MKQMDKSVLFVNIPTHLYRELRRLAYEKETTITSVVVAMIEEHLQDNKEISK
jgi:hypothetical protein